MCVKLYSAANIFDEYCGLLSKTNVSGIPGHDNIALNASITAFDVIYLNFNTSGYLE